MEYGQPRGTTYFRLAGPAASASPTAAVLGALWLRLVEEALAEDSYLAGAPHQVVDLALTAAEAGTGVINSAGRLIDRDNSSRRPSIWLSSHRPWDISVCLPDLPGHCYRRLLLGISLLCMLCQLFMLIVVANCVRFIAR